MNLKKHIPNAITSGNLLCGCIAILAASMRQFEVAGYFIFFAALFDFFDGFAARLLKAYSALGEQLDSLADMVSFGIAPTILLFKLIEMNFFLEQGQTMAEASQLPLDYSSLILPWPYYSILFIAVFSAIRLAKFNLDDRQTSYFIGLPTPANALLIASFPFICTQYPSLATDFLSSAWCVSALSIVLSFLLVSPIRLFSLKMRGWSWQINRLQYVYFIGGTLLIVCLGFLAVPFLLIAYLLGSLVFFRPERKL